jgi:hypothetical protein
LLHEREREKGSERGGEAGRELLGRRERGSEFIRNEHMMSINP